MPVKLFPFPNFSLRVLLLQTNAFEFIQGFYTDKVNREVRAVKNDNNQYRQPCMISNGRQ